MWLRVLFVVLLTVPSVALAQDDPAALLRHGVELRQQGNDEEAVREFTRAYEIAHSANAAGQLGLAEQALGRWLDAERHMREALAANDDRWVTRNRAALQAAYTVVQTHVGALDVRGEPAGAEVFVEGERVGTLPLAEPAHALVGTVHLEVRAEGRETVSRRVTIHAGRVAHEEVSLTAAASTAPIAAPSHGGIGAGIIVRSIDQVGHILTDRGPVREFVVPALAATAALREFHRAHHESTRDGFVRDSWPGSYPHS